MSQGDAEQRHERGEDRAQERAVMCGKPCAPPPQLDQTLHQRDLFRFGCRGHLGAEV